MADSDDNWRDKSKRMYQAPKRGFRGANHGGPPQPRFNKSRTVVRSRSPQYSSDSAPSDADSQPQSERLSRFFYSPLTEKQREVSVMSLRTSDDDMMHAKQKLLEQHLSPPKPRLMTPASFASSLSGPPQASSSVESRPIVDTKVDRLGAFFQSIGASLMPNSLSPHAPEFVPQSFTSPEASPPSSSPEIVKGAATITESKDSFNELMTEAAAIGLKPQFKEISSHGPSHLKSYTYEVKVGNEVATGQGIGKAKAKESAAQKALKEMKCKSLPQYKKTEKSEVPSDVHHPVSRLQEHLARFKHPLPEYTIVSKSGPSHLPTFKIGVKVLGKEYAGFAHSKKDARSRAAEAALADITKKVKTPNAEKKKEGGEEGPIFGASIAASTAESFTESALDAAASTSSSSSPSTMGGERLDNGRVAVGGEEMPSWAALKALSKDQNFKLSWKILPKADGKPSFSVLVYLECHKPLVAYGKGESQPAAYENAAQSLLKDFLNETDF